MFHPSNRTHPRACLQNARGAAARDLGWPRGGEAGISPQRAMTGSTTKRPAQRPAVRRIFEAKAGWRRCSSVEDPQGVFSFVAPCHPAFASKTASPSILKTRPKTFFFHNLEILRSKTAVSHLKNSGSASLFKKHIHLHYSILKIHPSSIFHPPFSPFFCFFPGPSFCVTRSRAFFPTCLIVEA